MRKIDVLNQRLVISNSAKPVKFHGDFSVRAYHDFADFFSVTTDGEFFFFFCRRRRFAYSECLIPCFYFSNLDFFFFANFLFFSFGYFFRGGSFFFRNISFFAGKDVGRFYHR